MIPVWLGSGLTVLWALGYAAGAYGLAIRAARGARPSVRFAAFLVCGFALPLAVFELLYFTGTFRWELVGAGSFGSFAAAAALFRRSADAQSALSSDANALRALGRSVRASPWRWLLYCGAFPLFSLHVARGATIPPIAWDALTYHLPRAALWVQEHGATKYAAPGAWGYYVHFPPLGDAISALAMVTPRSDALVGSTWAMVWLLLGAAVVALATTLGATGARAVLAAAAVLTVPCILVHMATAYVDTAAAALITLSLVLLVDFERRGAEGSGGVGLGALALALAIRQTAAPFVAGGLLAWLLGWKRHPGQGRRSLLLGSAMAAALLLPYALSLLLRFGSPIHPFGLRLFGHDLLPFEPELRSFYFSRPIHSLSTYVDRLFWHGITDDPLLNTNLGPPGFGLLLSALAVVVAQRGRCGRSVWCLLGSGFVGLFALVISARDWFVDDLRYLSALPAIAGAVVATSSARLTPAVLASILSLGIAWGLPFRFGPSDFEVATRFLLVLLLVAGLVALGARLARRRGRALLAAGVGALLGAVLLAASIEPLRAPFVARIRRDAARGESFTAGPLQYGTCAGALLLGELLDNPKEGLRIAVTAGWDGRGHNWFIYPLFGSRLQNHLSYISPVADGSIVSPAVLATGAAATDYDRWRGALVARRIDRVVTIGPLTVEAKWMIDHPSDFTGLGAAPPLGNFVFRVR